MFKIFFLKTLQKSWLRQHYLIYDPIKTWQEINGKNCIYIYLMGKACDEKMLKTANSLWTGWWSEGMATIKATGMSQKTHCSALLIKTQAK